MIDSYENKGRLESFVRICYFLAAALILILAAVHLGTETDALLFIKFFLLALVMISIAVVLSAGEGKVSPRVFAVLLFGASFLLAIAWAALIKTEPRSDFVLMYEYAEKLSHGDNSMAELPYFQNWSYQSGFVAWMAFCMRFFGAGIGFFKIMNCLLAALTNLLVYFTARRMASERGARAAGIIYLLYPGTLYLVSVLTNQHLSDFLILLSIYAYTSGGRGRYGRIINAALAGVLLALGNAIRPVGIIVVLAVAVCALIGTAACLLGKKGRAENRDRLRPLLLRTAVVIAVYFAVFAGLSGIVKISGMNENGLSNNRPEWKYIVGLNIETDGQYNADDEAAVFGDGVTDDDIEMLLKERKSIGVSDFFSLMMKKVQIMWGSYESIWFAFTENVWEDYGPKFPPGGFEEAIISFTNLTAAMYIWIYLLISIGAGWQLRKKGHNEVYLLLILTALAYFSAHLLIEVQSRYRFLMNVVAIPITSLGVDALLALWGSRRRNNEKVRRKKA